MADIQIDLPFASRFKRTRMHQEGGKLFFGVWKPPEIKLDGDEPEVRITTKDVGRLDRIAGEWLGSREYAWAIAHVNKIDYIPGQVVEGLVIVIPHLVRVEESLQAVEGDRT